MQVADLMLWAVAAAGTLYGLVVVGALAWLRKE